MIRDILIREKHVAPTNQRVFKDIANSRSKLQQNKYLGWPTPNGL
jgi:hypothetical protein